jgi:hypothetical protein
VSNAAINELAEKIAGMVVAAVAALPLDTAPDDDSKVWDVSTQELAGIVEEAVRRALADEDDGREAIQPGDYHYYQGKV